LIRLNDIFEKKNNTLGKLNKKLPEIDNISKNAGFLKGKIVKVTHEDAAVNDGVLT
jgi:hypothetical protein